MQEQNDKGQFVATNPVICGRKLCTSRYHRGPRWLPVSYFYVHTWNGAGFKLLQSRCKTCQRLTVRERDGFNQRRESHTGYRRRNENERQANNRYRRQRRARMTKAQRDDRREYERVKAEVKRREAGVRPRQFKRARPLPKNGAVTYLPIMPLSRWLAELVESRGQSKVSRESGVSEKKLRQIIQRKIDGKVLRRLTLAEVDRVLTRLGYPEELAILYPTEED